ncbi:MAG: hypothetical protein WCJ33_03995, partial [Pseudomonadota bacterium]
LQDHKAIDKEIIVNSSGNIKKSSEAIQNGKIKLPKQLVTEIFKISIGESTKAFRAANGDYLIANLQKIVPANPPAKDDVKVVNEVTDELKNSLANENIDNYLQYLRKKHKVTINEVAFGVSNDANGE